MPTKFSRNQLIILGAVGLIIIFFLLVFIGVIPGLRRSSTPATKPVTLEFWGVNDPITAFQDILDGFQKINPQITIHYRQLDSENYEKELVNAMAAGRGPDIFMLHNTWLAKHYDKISPLPPEKLSYVQFQQIFPTVAEQDFIYNKTVYASPLYVDTLALIRNNEIFDQTGVALSPATWLEFQNVIPAVRTIDAAGRIVRAGAAIGGSDKSISNSTDILTLLMLQKGVKMVADDFSRAVFSQTDSRGFSPGLSGLEFYLRFVNPINFDYTWNDEMPNSLDSFSGNNVGMVFAYASQLPLIKAKNPSLSFGISPMPQFDPASPINFANYWGLTVFKKSLHPNEAWDFINYLTINKDNVKSYLQTVKRPPALRYLIQEYEKDPDLGIFAKQVLSARSWYRVDSAAIREIFNNMIESVINGKMNTYNALRQAEEQVSQLMR